MTPEFKTFMSEVRGKTDSALTELLQYKENLPQHRLMDAMRYSVLNGGKRVRPALCFAAAYAATGDESAMYSKSVQEVACAVELIHAYSLVHDDLPAMDDDDLRRGNPTTHIAFDEATAVLAGDALQTKAFEILTNSDSLSAEGKIFCIRELVKGAGAMGMCGGQMIDLVAVGRSPSIEDLATMHALKTGALIRTSVFLGPLASGVKDQSVLDSLNTYAEAAGLAFQVKDDILDATSDTQTLGKRQGADAERNKPTYVSHLGLRGAEDKLEALREQAMWAIEPLGKAAQRLSELTNYIVQRAA